MWPLAYHKQGQRRQKYERQDKPIKQMCISHPTQIYWSGQTQWFGKSEATENETPDMSRHMSTKQKKHTRLAKMTASLEEVLFWKRFVEIVKYWWAIEWHYFCSFLDTTSQCKILLFCLCYRLYLQCSEILGFFPNVFFIA